MGSREGASSRGLNDHCNQYKSASFEGESEMEQYGAFCKGTFDFEILQDTRVRLAWRNTIYTWGGGVDD